MKHRTGFVSNSSSSSFIVKFPHKPTSIEDLGEMMGDCKPRLSYGVSDFSTNDVLTSVWRSISSGDVEVECYQCESPNDYVVSEIVESLGYDYDDPKSFYDAYVVVDRAVSHAIMCMNGESNVSFDPDIFEPGGKHHDMTRWPNYKNAIAILEDTGHRDWSMSEESAMDTQEYKIALFHILVAITIVAGNDEHRELYDTFPIPLYVKKDPNEFIAAFTYSDNDGHFYSDMEHGDIFRNVPHTKASHH